MRRITIAIAIAALCVAVPASTLAATPNNQACLGVDFSSYAEAGSGFGQFNASLAQYVPGLGFPIQLHLAGYISDTTIPNSCND
jgi:hypothetical protein